MLFSVFFFFLFWFLSTSSFPSPWKQNQIIFLRNKLRLTPTLDKIRRQVFFLNKKLFIYFGIPAVFAIPTGILCGAFLAENSKSRFAQVVSYLTDLLQGTPSVIIGIVTYIWVVVPMKGYSPIAGSVALFVMMLPLIIRSTEETLKILPASLKEAGLALGGNRARVMLKVQLPAAFGGIFTGVLLAISRVIGETAPLMFTALGCSFIRFAIDKPISAVPLLIWEFFNDPNLQELIWGASLFLLLFILTLNLTAKYLAKKWNQ